MTSWAVIELDTTPPAIQWGPVTVLAGELVVNYQLSAAEPIIAYVTDPDAVDHLMEIPGDGTLRYVLPVGTPEGAYDVRVVDDVLNAAWLRGILLGRPRHMLGRAAVEERTRGVAAGGLEVIGVGLGEPDPRGRASARQGTLADSSVIEE